MTNLIENTLTAYEKMVNDELDYVDILQLIESNIISEELLNSFLLEKNMDQIKLAYDNMKGKIKNLNHSNPIEKFDSITKFVNSSDNLSGRIRLHRLLPRLGVSKKILSNDFTGSYGDHPLNSNTIKMANNCYGRRYGKLKY